MLPIIILLVLGFFFPPAWLGLAGYVIYLAATKEKRRDKVICSHMAQMLAHGVDSMDVPNLYYDAAFSFAKAHGAQFEDWERPDIVFVFRGLEVAGRFVQPSFARLPGGGTRIELT